MIQETQKKKVRKTEGRNKKADSRIVGKYPTEIKSRERTGGSDTYGSNRDIAASFSNSSIHISNRASSNSARTSPFVSSSGIIFNFCSIRLHNLQ